ncbi:Mu transposase domain-containing protein [Streptomyces sp. NPDC088253]|uniref:Mu transposase domain-containing protein n=1 Tax=Streptomyces sp. NPDC088253 TaxID=3365846 RepID=UPI0038300A82
MPKCREGCPPPAAKRRSSKARPRSQRARRVSTAVPASREPTRRAGWRGGRRTADPLPSAEVGKYFAVERPLLRPLPTRPFEPAGCAHREWTATARSASRTNHYSVPVRLIGRRVWVMLHASELVFHDDGVEVARHERLMTKADSRPVPDHYLKALVRKPGALPGSTALEQARSAGKFTPSLWSRTRSGSRVSRP